MADSTRLAKNSQAKQFRYSSEADICLLREAVAVNPYAKKTGQGWHEIATQLAKTPQFPTSLIARTVRDRTNLLLDKFKKEQSQRQSNSNSSPSIVEEGSEKEQLLEELIQLQEDAQSHRSQNSSHGKANEEKDMGQLMREQAMEAMYMFPVTQGNQAEMQMEDEDVEVLALAVNRTDDVSSLSPEKIRRVEENNVWQFLQLKEESRIKIMEYQKQRDEAERLERQEEREWLREKDRLDREERKLERQRQREKEEFERQERREESQRQRGRDEQDREERKQMLQLLMTLINKK